MLALRMNTEDELSASLNMNLAEIRNLNTKNGALQQAIEDLNQKFGKQNKKLAEIEESAALKESGLNFLYLNPTF